MGELNLGIDITTSAKHLYNALLDSKALTQWFAEHTDISVVIFRILRPIVSLSPRIAPKSAA